MGEPAPARHVRLFWPATIFILCVLPILIGGPLFWLGTQLASGRANANESAICQRRQALLAQALRLYAADFDERLPLGDRWVDATWPRIAKKDPADDFESPFRCPAISKRRKIHEYGLALHEELAGLPLARIANPDRTPVVFDSDDLARNATSRPNPAPFPARHRNAKENYGAVVGGSVRTLP